jgi:hypothetical protein
MSEQFHKLGIAPFHILPNVTFAKLHIIFHYIILHFVVPRTNTYTHARASDHHWNEAGGATRTTKRRILYRPNTVDSVEYELWT